MGCIGKAKKCEPISKIKALKKNRYGNQTTRFLVVTNVIWFIDSCIGFAKEVNGVLGVEDVRQTKIAYVCIENRRTAMSATKLYVIL